jgi:hypothetical protein
VNTTSLVSMSLTEIRTGNVSVMLASCEARGLNSSWNAQQGRLMKNILTIFKNRAFVL